MTYSILGLSCSAQRTKAGKEKGFTLLEMVAAIAVLSSVILGASQLINQTVDDTKATVTALHMKTVASAARDYIHENYATVYTNATATNPLVIPVSTLVASGHLPGGFTSKNPRGQDTCLIVKSMGSNNMQVLVATENGDTIEDTGLGQIAAGIGSAGGAIYASDAANIKGAMGSWNFSKTVFNGANTKCDGSAGSVSLTAGHPMVALWYANGNTVNATLYRNAVPGNPDLNTMQTPIILGTGAVVSEGTACSTLGAFARNATGSLISCDGTTWKRQSSLYWNDPVATFAALPATGDVAGSVRMTLDTARAFMFNGTAWAALAVDQSGNLTVPNTLTAANGRVVVMDDVPNGGVIRLTGANSSKIHLANVNGTLRVVDDAGSGQLFTVDQNGDVNVLRHLSVGGDAAATGNISSAQTLSGHYLKATSTEVAGGACAPEGLISMNAAGVLLTCKSGAWKTASGAELKQDSCYWTGYGSCTASCPVGYYMAATHMGPYAGCGSSTVSPAAYCCRG